MFMTFLSAVVSSIAAQSKSCLICLHTHSQSICLLVVVGRYCSINRPHIKPQPFFLFISLSVYRFMKHHHHHLPVCFSQGSAMADLRLVAASRVSRRSISAAPPLQASRRRDRETPSRPPKTAAAPSQRQKLSTHSVQALVRNT